MSRNVAASVRARLKNRADATQEDYNLLLTRYGLERLLYRLSVSPHAPNFLLKGALLFLLWHELPHRPTRDADLLGFGDADVDPVVAVFRQVCAVACDDGMRFDTRSIRGEVIRKQAGYSGVRIEIQATLDAAVLSLQVDVGFGDVVTPAALAVTYPVLLDDLPAPQLRAYPKYTVCAEKLQALCVLGMANTRLKDYFDLWLLLGEGSLDTSLLGRAIAATFGRRGTALPDGWPAGLSDLFATDAGKQRQWQAFLRKNRLDAPDLADVIRELRTALAQPLDMARGPSA
ncbi:MULTISPECIES: nucleotidyl transferase AbiEii/AbiGii toxin family protein [Rhodanobacter]|uniref:nucleotidyl transferase AbiEii/AbiGii toxin family protein n=1 Tax=Rhodanobacter TaxID=75309 RepID=UPI000562426B|nr:MULTISPECIES: nucleotidyl transferase AbiEii/AbiGii toxin family protein [Rhodanobacter]TAN18104.1 MAG: nucleotidyl transferase AbiEii/AbiGii toxin family protein [Rhodanobacter sp.]UJJ55943.1 nucleotidyl transferase AbiEii/AbiGii toxin family protein [Rhodanobacter thiooxydans]